MNKQKIIPTWDTAKNLFHEYLAWGLSRSNDPPKWRLFWLSLHLFFAVFFTVCVGILLRMGVIVVVYQPDGFSLWELAVDVACLFLMALLQWIPAIHLFQEQRQQRRREKKWWL